MSDSQPFTPYRNLILSGYDATSRYALIRRIAETVGAPCLDLETEVQLRERLSLDELRQTYGEAHLRNALRRLCDEFALQRGAVIAMPAAPLLEEDIRQRLLESSWLLVLHCQLNEMLRRLHVQHARASTIPECAAPSCITSVRSASCPTRASSISSTRPT